MFTRRRTTNQPQQNVYKGVGINNNTNPGALAAAKTIGNAMKQKNTSNNTANVNIPRSQSFQQPSTNINSNGSLLKRGSRSSFQQPQQQQQQQSRRFSNGSFSSSTSNNSPMTNDSYNRPIVYDIDDSFNDSYLDEITEESTQVYLNNKKNLQDLKLPSHQTEIQKPVKMIKKYIPSPTGIKVIEVPESSFEKEIARHNSMRSNSLMSRSNSMRNVSQKKSTSRSSSLTNKQQKPIQQKRAVSSPLKMQSMNENVDLEEKLGKTQEKQAQEAKLKALEQEIEREKQLAKDLELKRLEYERLKKERLENEKRMQELQLKEAQNYIEQDSIYEEDEDEEDEPINKPNGAVNELDKIKEEEVGKDYKHEEEVGDDTLEDYTESSVRISVPVKAETIERPQLAKLNSEYTNSEATESNLDLTDFKSLDPRGSTTELGVINQYSELKGSDLEEEDDDDEIVDIPEAVNETFESQVEPEIQLQKVVDESELEHNQESQTFKTPQESNITTSSKAESSDTLLPPVIATATNSSSKSSVYSGDSNKRPMKSAMKSSTSFTQLPQQQQPNNAAKSNAAHQAYLSLTTAENTRLNSKLSNSQLASQNPIPNQVQGQHQHQQQQQQQHPDISSNDLYSSGAGGAYPQFAASQFQKQPMKRLSQQTLRKAPPPQQQQTQQPQQQEYRLSMRPQQQQQQQQVQQQQPQQRLSMRAPPQQQQKQPQGMSNRSLRPNSQVQPIAPHPALQPGYISPSKIKAQELYSKAQQRPYSNFNPPARNPNRPKSTTKEPRITLRDSQPPSATQNNGSTPIYPQTQTQEQQPSGSGDGFKSRFADSDDDLPLKKTFGSRFNDSDEDLPKSNSNNFQNSFNQPPPSQQQQQQQQIYNSQPQLKEKKKFGGKLKKLFSKK
ncbi:hypothetical protein KGF54_001497 [Candida jiufengensis]|uniref:uncharacterized protein n=1 Tax=Candida jiufengensis TaxID=497108 RepID=UPI00222476A7|nr:uncharacterized protein KGF54_001497 [Candida jiufengensis]KAI5954936.1 hypothetical protein KGF54_001497 [Candida jiufengensis]